MNASIQAWASSPDRYTSSTKIESIRVEYRVGKIVPDFRVKISILLDIFMKFRVQYFPSKNEFSKLSQVKLD